jgi:hypothetical protein
MRRREFITVIGGTAAWWSQAARAQQGESIRRVAMLLPYREGDAEGQTVVAAFQRRLQDLGWIEGRNIRFDIRWAAGDPDKARTFARELIGMAPDVIVPSSNLVTTIVQQETQTIPIVFVLVGDPVGSGYVASMAQPGGNVTGFAVLENAIAGKWVETLNEIAPQVSRVGFILHPETPANVGLLRAAENWRAVKRQAGRASCAQHSRDRACRNHVRDGAQWWPNRRTARHHLRKSRHPRRFGRALSTSRRLCLSHVRHQWRSHFLRD